MAIGVVYREIKADRAEEHPFAIQHILAQPLILRTAHREGWSSFVLRNVRVGALDDVLQFLRCLFDLSGQKKRSQRHQIAIVILIIVHTEEAMKEDDRCADGELRKAKFPAHILHESTRSAAVVLYHLRVRQTSRCGFLIRPCLLLRRCLLLLLLRLLLLRLLKLHLLRRRLCGKRLKVRSLLMRMCWHSTTLRGRNGRYGHCTRGRRL
mmetsp:Transcript_11585/g.29255  ORF Transcript_11585/g.29255 Transcript_11585/m.29255 type:complete len:209 (-) Transcript_11585:607-1233(-)